MSQCETVHSSRGFIKEREVEAQLQTEGGRKDDRGSFRRAVIAGDTLEDVAEVALGHENGTLGVYPQERDFCLQGRQW